VNEVILGATSLGFVALSVNNPALDELVLLKEAIKHRAVRKVLQTLAITHILIRLECLARVPRDLAVLCLFSLISCLLKVSWCIFTGGVDFVAICCDHGVLVRLGELARLRGHHGVLHDHHVVNERLQVVQVLLLRLFRHLFVRE